MADTDISPVVAAMVARIQSVPNVGQVHAFNLFNRTNIQPMLVSKIGGVDTLRAWWISGPSMTASAAVQRDAGELTRDWTYQVHGVVGVTEDGDSIATIRALGLAVTDALDASFSLDGTCHRTQPSVWQGSPENRSMIGGVGVSYVMVSKTVTTLSLP